MDCSAFIQSENTLDFIVARDEMEASLVAPTCVQSINEQYAIWYYDARNMPPLSIERYSYTAIPKVFWLMDSTSMEVSGILAMQNQPSLMLKGEGVLIGFVDTGIDYTNPLFRNSDGTTRIVSIWDQTEVRESQSEVNTGQQASGINDFRYGVIYEREQIDQALESENPKALVPETDENGHGTFLASLAAGGMDEINDFTGAAPLSELVVVKLKPAKQNLRDFFYLPEEEPLYQENDIMAGVAFLERIAKRENKPLVILIGLGSNQGSHTGTGPLSTCLSTIGALRKRVVVVAAGNEAATQHHFYGESTSTINPVSVEINVGNSIDGFCMELWTFAPELMRVVVQSPTGQRSQGGFPTSEEAQTTNFVFENTTLTLSYRIAGRQRGDMVIFFRFSQPTEGIWTVLVYPVIAITGAFHLWLPIQPQVGKTLNFIRPNPDTTITTPSAASVPITVGGYDGLTGARYIQSGRGFDALGLVKPDFCAPSINVQGAGLRGNFVDNTGTSVGAAITAGAAAQCLEWGILKGNAPTMNSVEVKNFLIRGCEREINTVYPNSEWGYGKLDIYQSFQSLRF